jgi:hypothetical protein
VRSEEKGDEGRRTTRDTEEKVQLKSKKREKQN